MQRFWYTASPETAAVAGSALKRGRRKTRDRVNTRSIVYQALHHPPELRLVVAREHIGYSHAAHVLRYQLAQYIAEIGSHLEIAPLIELFPLKTGPFAINSAALDAAAECKHHVRMAVVGAARSILFG